MIDCPLSFSALFQLMVAVEGLSLWGAFNTLPNSAKRIDLMASMDACKREVEGLPQQEKNTKYRNFNKECTKFEALAIQVRICKAIPNVLAIAMLVFYVGCPAIFDYSALDILADKWRPLCFAIIVFTLVRIAWFWYLFKYFKNFEKMYKKWVCFEGESSDNFSKMP